MHASPEAKSRDSRSCQAKPVADLHALFLALTAGGVLPAPAVVPVPAGVEGAPAAPAFTAREFCTIPPGPPPRA
jgi:hypothetical protein